MNGKRSVVGGTVVVVGVYSSRMFVDVRGEHEPAMPKLCASTEKPSPPRQRKTISSEEFFVITCGQDDSDQLQILAELRVTGKFPNRENAILRRGAPCRCYLRQQDTAG